MVSFHWQARWAHDQQALITMMPAALRSCMAVRMGVASRLSMWYWTATATDSCRHTRWRRHTLAAPWRVWSRWATPSTSLEENLPAPPSVGSAPTRPAAKVGSQICEPCGNFPFTSQRLPAGEWCCIEWEEPLNIASNLACSCARSDKHFLCIIFTSWFLVPGLLY